MRTPTITPRRRTPARISGPGLALAAVLALAACGGGGGGGGSKPTPAKPAGGAPVPSATSSAQSDPAAGPVQDPATLPKTCNGLVTDADIQLNLGQPLAGGDLYSVYQPLPSINQTKRVKCEYGVVQNSSGGLDSAQIEVQVATYSDAKSAAARAAGTVGQFAAKQAKYEQVAVGGHPATYVTETTDEVLVMYDGNRTFLITLQAGLAKGDDARKLVLALGQALYGHVTPAAGSASTPPAGGSASGAAGGASGTPSAPVSSGSSAPGSAPSS